MRRPIDFGYFLELLALGGEMVLSLVSKKHPSPLKHFSKLSLAQKVYRTAEVSAGVILITFAMGWVGHSFLN